jgi:hypothetical protein
VARSFLPSKPLSTLNIDATRTLIFVHEQWAQTGLRTPYLTSTNTLPFTALLAAFEGLLLWYWVSLRLGQVLLYGAILAPLTAFAGKTALVAVQERRLTVKK